ncbi:MAG: branched-chain amino acid ABC transporter permease [Alphaproteobacteria bacterium]|nr:branched-chain amino acid ABC transporter permease [Alphaproteobacteria bacterium]
MSLALQLLVNGLVSGGLLGVAALGVALIFGVMRVVNFAHGEFITLGAYATWLLVSQLHLSPLVGLPVAFVLGALVGVVVQAVVLARVTGRPELDVLMVTYALSVLGLGLFAQGFGGDFRSYSQGPHGNLDVAGAIIGWRSLTVLLACVAMSGATVLVIQRTRLGLGLRALAQNRDSAATCGINVVAAERIAFALASGLAAAAGCLVSMIGTTTPNVGHDLVLDAFVVVILGGMGSISGALVGALALGLVQSVVSYALDDSWSRMVAYLLLYCIILLRPQGLFGRAAA